MARNLRKGLSPDHTLLICDVNEDAIARFQEETAGDGPVREVGNGFDAAQDAVCVRSPQTVPQKDCVVNKLTESHPYEQDVIITMLPDSRAVRQVYMGDATSLLAGVSAAARSSSSTAGSTRQVLLMECGTIETDTILAAAEAVRTTNEELSTAQAQNRAKVNVTFVDAPVSGGPMGAQDGSLTFMVGSNTPEAFAQAKKYLDHMGKPDSIFHCGDVGAGTAFKVINNYLSAITSLAASEALNIGVKMGLDPKLLSDVINVSGGQCWVTSKSNPVPGVMENVPSSRDYEGGFRLALCAKVLGMGSRLAEMVGARTVLDKPTLEAFQEAIEGGYGAKDARVVYKWLNESEKK